MTENAAAEAGESAEPEGPLTMEQVMEGDAGRGGDAVEAAMDAMRLEAEEEGPEAEGDAGSGTEAEGSAGAEGEPDTDEDGSKESDGTASTDEGESSQPEGRTLDRFQVTGLEKEAEFALPEGAKIRFRSKGGELVSLDSLDDLVDLAQVGHGLKDAHSQLGDSRKAEFERAEALQVQLEGADRKVGRANEIIREILSDPEKAEEWRGRVAKLDGTEGEKPEAKTESTSRTAPKDPPSSRTAEESAAFAQEWHQAADAAFFAIGGYNDEDATAAAEGEGFVDPDTPLPQYDYVTPDDLGFVKGEMLKAHDVLYREAVAEQTAAAGENPDQGSINREALRRAAPALTEETMQGVLDALEAHYGKRAAPRQASEQADRDQAGAAAHNSRTETKLAQRANSRTVRGGTPPTTSPTKPFERREDETAWDAAGREVEEILNATLSDK